MSTHRQAETMAYVAVIGGLLVLLSAAAGLAVAARSYQCHSAWADSGMPARYKLRAGCQVQRKDGTWVPSGAIRNITP